MSSILIKDIKQIKNKLSMINLLTNNNIALYSFLPEIFMTGCILFQLIFAIKLRNRNLSSNLELNKIIFIQCIFILICTLCLLFACDSFTYSFKNFFLYNTPGTFILKKLIIFFSLLAIVPLSKAFFLQKLNFFEFYTLYLFSILSSLLLISAGDFLSIYLLIEMQSLCFYMLAAFRKDSTFSVDAGMKYFIFGSLISCVFIMGLSILYGCLSTLNLRDISVILISFPLPAKFWGINLLIMISLVLISIVLLFKVGAVPFHFWVPDIYEGSPLSATIIFSYLPKLVYFDLIIKISHAFGDAFIGIKYIFLLIGILSIVFGSFFAVQQKRLKRFLIYSSISQVGFPLILLGSFNIAIESTVYFFLFFYTITSILIWAAYVVLYQFAGKSELDEKKLLKTPLFISHIFSFFSFDILWTFVFILVFFSISGIPPLSGFLIKVLILENLIAFNQNYYIAAILIFLSSISIFYYVRIIKTLFFETTNLTQVFIFDSQNEFKFFFRLNCIIIIFCLFLVLQSILFFDFWLILSKYLFFNLFF